MTVWDTFNTPHAPHTLRAAMHRQRCPHLHRSRLLGKLVVAPIGLATHQPTGWNCRLQRKNSTSAAQSGSVDTRWPSQSPSTIGQDPNGTGSWWSTYLFVQSLCPVVGAACELELLPLRLPLLLPLPSLRRVLEDVKLKSRSGRRFAPNSST